MAGIGVLRGWPGRGTGSLRLSLGLGTTGLRRQEMGEGRTGHEGATKGSRDYPGRLLVPSPIPPMDSRIERLAKLRRSEGIECPQGFPYWPKALTIPANTEVRLLLDNDYLTTGYFSLAFSKGKEAEIHIGYSEALYKQEEESTTKSYALNGKRHRTS